MDQAVNTIVFGPYERKVQKFLDEATIDSVLEGLGRVLTTRMRVEVGGLWRIFDSYILVSRIFPSNDPSFHMSPHLFLNASD